MDVFALFVAFQVKHFIADYPLQTSWMLGKTRGDWGFVLPLLGHSMVHAVMTLALVALVNPGMWWLAAVDGVSHFVIDRMKAGPRYLNRFAVSDARFWYALGLDQMLHHLVGIGIIWALMTASH